MNKTADDFPFADLLGLKPKKLTEQQEIGKKLLDISKKFNKKNDEQNSNH